jgi:predicted ATPase
LGALGLEALAHAPARPARRGAAALEAIAKGHAQLEDNNERYYLAELLRLKGEARLQLDPRALADAVSCFRRALHVAREQGARSFEQKAAEALGRFEGVRVSEAPPELSN